MDTLEIKNQRIEELENELKACKKTIETLKKNVVISDKYIKKFGFAVCKNCKTEFVKNTSAQKFCKGACRFDYAEKKQGR